MSLPNGNNPTGYFCRHVSSASAKTNQTLVTPPSGMRAVLTLISVFTDNATTPDVAVTVGFGASSLPTPGSLNDGIAFFHPGIPGDGKGFTVGDGSGIIGYGEKDELVLYTHEVATDGALSIHVVGYFAEAQQVAT